MFKFSKELLIVAAFALAGASAEAAPIAGGSDLKTQAKSEIVKVHGWHRYCAWGPARFHRHVPGIGNVPCYGGGWGWHNRWRSHHRWESGGWGWHNRWRSHHRWGSGWGWHNRWRSHHRWGSWR